MSASPLAARPPLALRIHGTAYPVLLPNVRDPRLRIAAVLTSLQVIGQTAFGFELSIAQILVALLTCAVLELGITFRRQRVIMWPASALLTGNGIAFVLRVPGTEHGDWWSMKGWWIFAGTATVAILSKHLIRFRGHHFLNPSNFRSSSASCCSLRHVPIRSPSGGGRCRRGWCSRSGSSSLAFSPF